MIYLDNAATTPMSAVAIAEMTKVMQKLMVILLVFIVMVDKLVNSYEKLVRT